MATEGTIEVLGRTETNLVGGWYGLKKAWACRTDT